MSSWALEVEGEILVCRVTGGLDYDKTQQLKQELLEYDGGRFEFFLLDLAELTELDNYFYGPLLSLLREVRGRGGDIKLLRINPPVFIHFQSSQLNRIFEIFNCRTIALNSFPH